MLSCRPRHVRSPNININRDPRWGRNQEVPSEDPLLNGEFGKLYTMGLQQGEDSRYTKVVVTLKHWDAYSLEDSDGFTRHNFDAKVSNFALMDTYWPAFRKAVMEGNAKGVMCSYNALNGRPTCTHPLLTKVLRDIWKFDGYVTSDTGAIEDIYAKHHYTANASAAVAAALRDGRCDMDSGAVYHDALLDAVNSGECSMDDVDRALYNTLKLRFELGLFDPIEDQPYWRINASSINTTYAQDLNMKITLESMILLQNHNNALPFKKGRKVAVIGPHINAQEALVGNYLGQLCPDDSFDCITSPLAAIEAINGMSNTVSAMGSGVLACTDASIQEAVNVAKDADYVVLLIGINDTIEAESNDRTSIDLPQCQHKLTAAIAHLNKTTAAVLINGGMLAIEQEKKQLPAIIEAGYPGFYGGAAIAKTIFGDNNHLGGKLPYTVYPADYIHKINMSDMEMTNSPGRSYRYYTGQPLWPFGFGLAYTTFSVQSPGPSASTFATGSNTSFSLPVHVVNTGKRTGDTVVQVYMAPVSLPHRSFSLKKQLIAFERVHLTPNQRLGVTIPLSADVFNMVDPVTGNVVSTPGSYRLVVSDGVAPTLRFSVSLHGDEVVVEKFPSV
ncbi:hypothetical protein PTSG_04397 [Salpingoeca rosetta]|uniref:Fibronectin type III-like domain-containing protein n=1 Tax=Salpingoeca rosetta (strain ATCC 50818 / BSB-021) TaxID=946362 RepID=F2U8F8_SALR5|nr:uncharacterized protein PTSG_04397 [Salpingoeca rosetta]EGD72666.1 hypothetical protein PTSG_04397 [Salpingoeca rosetta]|eukprot:XP_004994489.1 hypothetical protein PTSG_04397 [Salpingoeca rosetta]